MRVSRLVCLIALSGLLFVNCGTKERKDGMARSVPGRVHVSAVNNHRSRPRPHVAQVVDPYMVTLDKARWLLAVAASQPHKSGTRASHPTSRGSGIGNPFLSEAPAVPASLADVIACIKQHESGDYTEHSHPSDGSGAYQFIPGTWRTWSARAGLGGYSFAYLAPPNVQDSVIIYALTHGGAGNWSEKFGADPCTAGLPGGG